MSCCDRPQYECVECGAQEHAARGRDDAIASAALAETRAMHAWEATRGDPFTVQAAAFDRLKAAYEARVALCDRDIRRRRGGFE